MKISILIQILGAGVIACALFFGYPIIREYIDNGLYSKSLGYFPVFAIIAIIIILKICRRTK